MKKPIPSLHSISSVTALAVILAFSFTARAWQGMPIQKLHVSGRNIQDPTGKNVLLHGYMQPGNCYFNGGCGVNFVNPTAYNPSDAASALTFYKNVAELMSHTAPLFGKSHGWYCSFVRFVDDSAGPAPGWDSNGNLSDSAKFNRWINNVLVPYADYCRSVGLYLVLCGNPSEVFPGGDGTKNMTAQYKQNLITFWTTVANNPGIKSKDNVMFEICNEPVNIESSLGNGQWGWGNDTYNRAFQIYMQDIANAIRNTGADNIIWIPALGWQTALSAFVNFPISGSNIGYAGHWYPYGDNVASHFTDNWNANWKPCTDRFPLIITEMMWNPNDSYGLISGTTEVFGNTSKNLFDTAGNVSFLVGMTGDDIGNLDHGWASITFPTKAGGQVAFDWWPTYTWAAPSGGGGPIANGTYKLIARHSGKAMDASGNGTANGTQIIQWTYGGGNNQRWTLTDRGGGQYSIIGVQSGKCVEVSNWGTGNGTKVQLWDYLAGTNQKHTFSSTGSGYYRITPTHATGSCLDVSGVSMNDGALVQLWQWLSGNNQQWAPQAP